MCVSSKSCGADRAFDEHLDGGSSFSFSYRILGMKRKQAMSTGDHSHEDLVFLASLNLSFSGWEKKVEEAVNRHRSGLKIDLYRFSLPERQRMFEGDRSHPRLVALDALTLRYPGHEEDVKEVEEWEQRGNCFRRPSEMFV